MRVDNRKCIRHLGLKSLKAEKYRNRIAVGSIILTTMMFTALFTIIMSIIYGFQQANFRQVGGYEHGGFKYLTKEQFEELKEDDQIREYSMRRFVGAPFEEPFNKAHVEVSYLDANGAKWMYLDPAEGRLPEENTNEAATDTRVLSLLGIEPEIGREFTLTFDVDGTRTTETFTLCGYWEYDEAIVASHVLIPESRVDEIFTELDTKGEDGMTGTYNLDVMLKSKADIEQELLDILERHGYQNETVSDNYIRIGVNWGYASAQLMANLDFATVLAIGAGLLLIIFTGYLIIYNVFNISVSNDIRRYGLLKTVGTTGRQIKRIVYMEAAVLSAVGIPIGLVLGYLCGCVLVPMVVENLDGVVNTVSVSPLIFIGAAVFSLVTVFLSCRKPAKTASKVSPVEAVRYTEGGSSRKSLRKTRKGFSKGKLSKGNPSLSVMAFANLGRSKSKTIVTVISLSLSVVLLCVTHIFTLGFDMDKYISSRVLTDYLVADASYFNVMNTLWGEENALTEDVISYIEQQGGIEAAGRTYGMTGRAYEYVTEEWFRNHYGQWTDAEALDQFVETTNKQDGLLEDDVQLYGMEPFCLDKLKVIEGDISKLDGEGNYVAAVYMEDDYGNVESDTHWAKIGDKVKVRYVEELEYYNLNTGEGYSNPDDIPATQPYRTRAVSYHDKEYEVAALVVVPNSLSYRYYGRDEFVMSADLFKRDTQTDAVMYYAFDMKEDGDDGMERFLADFTTQVRTQFDYESKATYAEEFESFRSMFVIMGSVLSFITGLVGVLNFLNAVLTGIITRRREFAVLQSIGMTGRQLKTMLVYEGLYYTLGAVLAALILDIVFSPLFAKVIESTFAFFSYRFTAVPVFAVMPVFLILGSAIPLVAYRSAARKSVVERIREAE